MRSKALVGPETQIPLQILKDVAEPALTLSIEHHFFFNRSTLLGRREVDFQKPPSIATAILANVHDEG